LEGLHLKLKSRSNQRSHVTLTDWRLWESKHSSAIAKMAIYSLSLYPHLHYRNSWISIWLYNTE